MRALIGAGAFLGSFLLVLAIGGTCARPAQERAPDELARWVERHGELLLRLAPAPGVVVSGLPAPLGERFDLAGCEPDGRPWYRLRGSAPPAGLIRADGSGPPAVLGERVSARPLAGAWWYWERSTVGHAP